MGSSPEKPHVSSVPEACRASSSEDMVRRAVCPSEESSPSKFPCNLGAQLQIRDPQAGLRDGRAQRPAAAKLEIEAARRRGSEAIRKLRDTFERDARAGQIEHGFLRLRVIENVAGNTARALAQVGAGELESRRARREAGAVRRSNCMPAALISSKVKFESNTGAARVPPAWTLPLKKPFSG